MKYRWLMVVAVILAVVLEALGVAMLFTSLSREQRLLGYLLGHGLACMVLTLVLLAALPERYRGNLRLTGAFLLTLQFAIPFVGSLGVILGILLALYLPREPRSIPWQEVAIPELPYQPIDMGAQVIYSQGGLRQVLREASDPDKRLQALMATRQMAPREAIAILQEALKDPTDDVRLLAYSMLEQKEKALAQQAGVLKQALENTSEKERVRVQRRLVQVWWEMAFLGLAQGGLRQYYLQNAAELLDSLVARTGMHSDWRLLGRVRLAQGEYAQAEASFNKALETGSPQEAILPYLAEAAFLRRDFPQVRALLRQCPLDRIHPANRPIIEAWT